MLNKQNNRCPLHFLYERKLFAGPYTWAKQESKRFSLSPRLYKLNVKLNDALFSKDEKATFVL